MTNFSETTDALRSLVQNVQTTLLLPRLKGRQLPTFIHQGSPIPPLNLPLPEDIDRAFDGLKVSSQTLLELTSKYRHHLQQLQQLHRQKFEQACRELCQLPPSKHFPLSNLIENLRKVTESIYTTRYLPMMRNEIVAIRSQYSSAPETKRIPFNAEYTPLLEKYFERNAYPSAPDRQVLAQKTTMTPRQIEVWFQNHRKRAKENGKAINRMSPNTAHNFSPSLKKLALSTSDIIARDDQNNGSDITMTSIKKVDELSELRAFTATESHVFPNRFSSSAAIYHFHTHTCSTFTFPPSVWIRKPATQSINRSDINFDEFVATFAAKLNIRDGASRSKRKSLFRSQTQNPWFFATTTIPTSAPLPAFIESPRPSPPRKQETKTPSSSTPLSSAFPQPLTTTMFSPSLKQPRLLKKASPFPRRYPSNYHPYSHVSDSTLHRSLRLHSVESVPSFASRASSIKSMPSRTSRVMVMDPTSLPASWVANLESPPPLVIPTTPPQSVVPSANQETTLDYTPPAVDRVTSESSIPSSGSRVTSFDSNSSFGSRTSSLSSLESPFPSSPTLQPQTDDTLVLDHQDLQFLGELSDFDRLMMDTTQLSFDNDLFSPKPDGIFGYAFHHLQNTMASFPMNFMQTLS